MLNFTPKSGGQFELESGGQFDRFFQIIAELTDFLYFDI
jgi:hypothetical protein